MSQLPTTMSAGISSSTISLNSSVAESIPNEPPAEDSIKVVCRFRPLNSAEEKAGSKFVANFKDENCVSLGVRVHSLLLVVSNGFVYAFKIHVPSFGINREKCTSLIKFLNPMLLRKKFMMMRQNPSSKASCL